MRKMFLMALMPFSIALHGQNVEIAWSEESSDNSTRNCVPTVDVDYDREELVVEVSDDTRSALVVVSDDFGNYSYMEVTSGNPVSLNIKHTDGEEIRLDVFANGNHGVGYLQKED